MLTFLLSFAQLFKKILSHTDKMHPNLLTSSPTPREQRHKKSHVRKRREGTKISNFNFKLCSSPKWGQRNFFFYITKWHTKERQQCMANYFSSLLMYLFNFNFYLNLIKLVDVLWQWLVQALFIVQFISHSCLCNMKKNLHFKKFSLFACCSWELFMAT